MDLTEAEIEQAYVIVEVPRLNPCMNCHFCTMLRLMEVGLNPGEIVTPMMHQWGIWVIKLEGSSSHIALRDEEARRVIVKKI